MLLDDLGGTLRRRIEQAQAFQLIAEEIEEPFGLDENDLPTDELSEKISENVREILNT